MSVALCSDGRAEVNERSFALALGLSADTGGSGTMSAAEAPHIPRFNCPNCDAIYDLVRTKPSPPPPADAEWGRRSEQTPDLAGGWCLFLSPRCEGSWRKSFRDMSALHWGTVRSQAGQSCGTIHWQKPVVCLNPTIFLAFDSRLTDHSLAWLKGVPGAKGNVLSVGQRRRGLYRCLGCRTIRGTRRLDYKRCNQERQNYCFAERRNIRGGCG